MISSSERGTRNVELEVQNERRSCPSFRVQSSEFRVLLAIVVLASSAWSASAQSSQPLVVVDRPPLFAAAPSIVGGKLKFLASSKHDGAPEPIDVDLADLVSWGAPLDVGRGAYLVGCDGGILAIDKLAMTDEKLEFTSPQFGPRSISPADVRGVVFRSTATPRERDRLIALLRNVPNGDRDRLLLLGGDELVGTLTTLDERGASLETNVGPAKIEAGRLAALVFNPALASKPAEPRPRLIVGLRDGSLVISSTIESMGAHVRLAPVAVGEDKKSWEVDAAEIVYLQTLGGRATYLSDLTPSGYKHVPYFELSRPYHLDANSEAGPLRVGGRRYLKGIGMHSTSRLTFPLDPASKRFAAQIAIDDDADGRGSVTFRVFVDAAERFASPVVRGGDPPTPFEIDVSGGRTLSLVVDFAERGDELDHADWLNARLTP